MFTKKKLNVLVTGAKGQLGSYLVDAFRKKSFKECSIFGQVFGIDIDDLDISRADEVEKFFNRRASNPPVKIDYVIHCAAATNTTAIEKDPFMFYSTNVIGTKNIAEACVLNKIKLIYISTDYVLSELSCENGFFSSEFPVNQYGLQKLLAEKYVESAYKKWQDGYAIARSSWMFGNSKNSFIEKLILNIVKQWENQHEHNERINVNVVNDAYGRPTSVDHIANALLEVFYNGIPECNIVHIQPDYKQISRYDWATMILDSLKEVANCNDECNVDLKKMLSRIDIMPAKSDWTNGMRHPGRVDSFYDVSCAVQENSIAYYKSITKDYIGKNKDRLFDLIQQKIIY